DRYAQPAVRADFFRRVTSSIEAMPGVEAVGGVSLLPLLGQTNIMGLTPETRPDWFSGGAQAEYRTATGGYFAAMGIPLLRGEIFDDRPDEPKTAVINQQAAKRLWPGEDPVGKRFERRNRQDMFVVTGVVGDVRSENLDREPPLMAYTPFAQQPL